MRSVSPTGVARYSKAHVRDLYVRGDWMRGLKRDLEMFARNVSGNIYRKHPSTPMHLSIITLLSLYLSCSLELIKFRRLDLHNACGRFCDTGAGIFRLILDKEEIPEQTESPFFASISAKEPIPCQHYPEPIGVRTQYSTRVRTPSPRTIISAARRKSTV